MRGDEILAGALPEPPPPSRGARQRAVAAALAALDEKNASASQGSATVERPRDRTGTPPVRSHGTRVMNRKGWAVAAGVLVSVGSAPLVAHLMSEQSERTLPAMRLTVGEASRATVQGSRAPSMEMAQNLSKADSDRIATQSMQGGRAMPTVLARPDGPTGRPDDGAVAVDASGMPPGVSESARWAMQQSVIEAMRLGTGQLQGDAKANQAMALARPYYAAPGFAGAPPAEAGAPAEPQGRDSFKASQENPYKVTREDPVSTFSMDVDTASYSFARASLSRNALPPKASVRTEEFVNYFPYAYPAPSTASEPFRATVSTFPSPWNEGRRIVHVGLKAYAVAPAERPPANLVFLVDTSGSMEAPDRLPLAKQALSLLVGQLDARDKVAIVAYAGEAGTVLEPTQASEKGRILAAIERLGAGVARPAPRASARPTPSRRRTSTRRPSTG